MSTWAAGCICGQEKSITGKPTFIFQREQKVKVKIKKSVDPEALKGQNVASTSHANT